jgi:hypothetical protein
MVIYVRIVGVLVAVEKLVTERPRTDPYGRN